MIQSIIFFTFFDSFTCDQYLNIPDPLDEMFQIRNSDSQGDELTFDSL